MPSRSQRHLRTRGVDSAGVSPYGAGDAIIPIGVFTKDLAGQTVAFGTLFPTGTNFVLSATPTGMSLNAGTGLLNGTPTTVQTASPTLTVTYTINGVSRVEVFNWMYEVGADAVTAGAYTQNVAITPLNFKTSFPAGAQFLLENKPTGLSLDATTGILSGTPTVVEADATDVLTVRYQNGAVLGSRQYTWGWAVTA